MNKYYLVCVVLLVNLFLISCNNKNQVLVEIYTQPENASIYIDGERRATSPTKKWQSVSIYLSEGEHVVRAVIDTGGPMEYFSEKPIFISFNTLQTVNLKLKKRNSKKFIELLKEKYGNKIPEPEMVEIFGGSFKMGCEISYSCKENESPPHDVVIPSFSLSRYEITFEQWDYCAALGFCHQVPGDAGWGRANRPVINVSWDDVQIYIQWLNAKTGGNYRLPTEAEWEYAASKSPLFHSNHQISNCSNCGGRWENKKTAPVGSFVSDNLGLYDIFGNVSEWVQDCYHKNYSGAPGNAAAWMGNSCYEQVIRGGAWNSFGIDDSSYLRRRDKKESWLYANNVGFRLARTH